MTAQERPSLGQPPHLTLPHTQCSHRNTYKDLERRPARGRRGKKSLRRARWGQEGVGCPDPKQLQDKTSQRHAGRGRVAGGDCPRAAPQPPGTVAYNKVQICPADRSILPHLSPRATSLQATKRCLPRHTLQEDLAKEFKGQVIELIGIGVSRATPLLCVQNTPNAQQTTQIPQRQRLATPPPLALPRYFLSDPFFSLHLLTQGL